MGAISFKHLKIKYLKVAAFTLIFTLNCSRAITTLCVTDTEKFKESIPREPISIKIGDAFISGYIFKPFLNKQKYPAVIIAHTLGGSKEDQTNLIARRIAKNGFLSLIFDLDGHGTNPRRFGITTILENIPKAVNYLHERDDIDKSNIFVLGANLGAVLAIKAGVSDPRIKGVIAIAALYKIDLNLLGILSEAQISRVFLPSTIRFSEQSGNIINLINIRLKTWDIINSISKLSPRPILLIHAESDAIIGKDQAEFLFKHATHPKDIKIVPNEKYHTLLVSNKTSSFIVEWLEQRI